MKSTSAKVPGRLTLAQLPTPVETLPSLSKQLGVQVHAWRDDLTGSGQAGCKVRRLEYFLHAAREARADTVVTCGSVHSNHAHATAAIASRAGFHVHLILRHLESDAAPPALSIGPQHADSSSAVTYVSPSVFARDGYTAAQGAVVDELAFHGRRPYVIPPSGSSALGCWGAIRAVQELTHAWARAQLPGTHPTALVCAVGSGCMLAGLRLGFAVLGLPPDTVHGVTVDRSAADCRASVQALEQEAHKLYGLPKVDAPVQVHEGFVGAGYRHVSEAERWDYARWAADYGLLLDACHTGKAFRGLVALLRSDPDLFGKQVVFVHSGGQLVSFRYRQAYGAVLPPAGSG